MVTFTDSGDKSHTMTQVTKPSLSVDCQSRETQFKIVMAHSESSVVSHALDIDFFSYFTKK